jgi:hypothetical protein
MYKQIDWIMKNNLVLIGHCFSDIEDFRGR